MKLFKKFPDSLAYYFCALLFLVLAKNHIFASHIFTLMYTKVKFLKGTSGHLDSLINCILVRLRYFIFLASSLPPFCWVFSLCVCQQFLEEFSWYAINLQLPFIYFEVAFCLICTFGVLLLHPSCLNWPGRQKNFYSVSFDNIIV